MCQSGGNEFDFGKLKSYDDETLIHQALGWIPSFDIQWGENLVLQCHACW